MEIDETYKMWKSLQPLTESQQYKLNRVFTVEYNYNSNRMEGNTLTYGQTEVLLLFGKVVGEGRLKDFMDMKASEVAVNMMFEEAKSNLPLTQNFIRTLHYTLLREDFTEYRTLPCGCRTSYTIHAGQYKTRPNSVVTRYGDVFEYASPEETPALMANLVDWYNQESAQGNLTPIELASLFHYRYIRIHPFEDGNGRIARLLVNYILLQNDWPAVVVRSRKKQEYIDALHQSDVVVGPYPSDGANASITEIRHFLGYFKQLVNSEIKYNIDLLKSAGEDIWWYDGERIEFKSPNTSNILLFMQLNPNASVSDLARNIGINKYAIQKQLANLLKKGYIQRTEPGGLWHVLAFKS